MLSDRKHQQGLPTPWPGEPKEDLGRYLVAVLVGAQKWQGLWEKGSEPWQDSCQPTHVLP